MLTSENLSRTLLLFIVFCLGTCTANRNKRQIIFEDDSNNRVLSSDCRTPDRRPGRCVRLTSCAALARSTPRNQLRRYFCGFEGEEPKVCCPQSMLQFTTPRPIIRNTTPPRPTIRTTLRTTFRTTQRPRPTVPTGPRISGETRPPFLPSECGVTSSSNHRIINGQPAEVGGWPWMAVVMVRKSNGAMSPDCGGALVSPQHVVTAAHCVVTGSRSRPLDPSRVSVRLGAHNLKNDREPNAINVNVEEIRRHESFEPRTYKNDIAVLKLNRPVQFTRFISPICLPYDSIQGEDIVNHSTFIIGYGTTAFNGNSSDVLMEAQVLVQPDKACVDAYTPEVQYSRVYLCAGMMDGSKDACQGDSGGPLMKPGRQGRFYLIGVVSFGKQCGLPNTPGVYTRVTEFLNWLARNLSN